MTAPENFRRDIGVCCPVCLIGQHSFESMQLHYRAHTEEEKRLAWEETIKKHTKRFMLMEVGE